MQDQGELDSGWHVEVRDLNLKKVWCELHKQYQVLPGRNLNDKEDDAIQDVIMKGPRYQPMLLGQFDDVFMVVDHWLEFLINIVSHPGRKPDVGLKQVSQ